VSRQPLSRPQSFRRQWCRDAFSDRYAQVTQGSSRGSIGNRPVSGDVPRANPHAVGVRSALGSPDPGYNPRADQPATQPNGPPCPNIAFRFRRARWATANRPGNSPTHSPPVCRRRVDRLLAPPHGRGTPHGRGSQSAPYGSARAADVSDGRSLGPAHLPCPGRCRARCPPPAGSKPLTLNRCNRS
jgi:hypothetical protein